jgi:hypothetical protein
MTSNLALTRLVDRSAIEIVVDALLNEGLSREETVLAIVHDIPTDLDVLNEVLDTRSDPNKTDGSKLIH